MCHSQSPCRSNHLTHFGMLARSWKSLIRPSMAGQSRVADRWSRVADRWPCTEECMTLVTTGDWRASRHTDSLGIVTRSVTVSCGRRDGRYGHEQFPRANRRQLCRRCATATWGCSGDPTPTNGDDTISVNRTQLIQVKHIYCTNVHKMCLKYT